MSLLCCCNLANRNREEPTDNRLDLFPSPPDSTLPETDIVGSIRIERMVYMSRMMGSFRGPPTKGDDSGCDVPCVSVLMCFLSGGKCDTKRQQNSVTAVFLIQYNTEQ